MNVINILKYTKKFQRLANTFDCENQVINSFIRQDYAFDENQGITYIMVDKNMSRIIGFYTIETSRIDEEECIDSTKILKPMGGAIHINYFAMNKEFQKYKIGKINGRNIHLSDYLLTDCENRILSIRNIVGASFITLSSTEQGYNLYKRNSYENFEDDMYIAIKEKDLYGYKMYKCIDDIDL